ncbi:MAG TPA: DUF885 domain-containing protein [Propionibacteriaceae bacterium]|nr:DUF885 domain-containing protein [Propionibacteriaceae bacterium]
MADRERQDSAAPTRTSSSVSRSGAARPVDEIADRYVAECVERYPELATELGVAGHDHAWSNYSPDGHLDRVRHVQQTVAALRGVDPVDEAERLAREVMLERLEVEVELFEAHITPSRVSVMVGAAQEIRYTFDLMRTDSEEAWANIAARLRTVEAPLQQTQRTLLAEAAQGQVSAVRQIRGTADQIRAWTGQTGDADFFDGLVNAVPAAMSDVLRAEVAESAARARAAFADFGRWLTDNLVPLAPSLDAVGEERYALDLRSFLGATVDVQETYAWGWEELRRIVDEQRAIARELVGSDDLFAAYAALDADPARRIAGAEAFRDWMQRLSDQAVNDLAGTHFDIAEEIRAIECCLAPTHDGLIYYTAPSEDFSRPGRMWWAVPEGVTEFSTWKEATTVYHEGVPGHHLQIAQSAYRSDLLNRWQRQLCYVSGHGEGWALYAERLMDDLGYLTDSGDKMGMLDAHAFRAIRVIIDIGMHLQLEIPADNFLGFHPGERWTPALGLEFLRANCASDEPTLRFELDRYLGWPGQAPSYKVGERIWLEARDQARARRGGDFDLRQFHADALNLGPVGLDALRRALARM